MIDICQLSIEISAFLSMHRTYVGIDVQVIHCEQLAHTRTHKKACYINSFSMLIALLFFFISLAIYHWTPLSMFELVLTIDGMYKY